MKTARTWITLLVENAMDIGAYIFSSSEFQGWKPMNENKTQSQCGASL
jgi:hypothetical protein